MGKGDKVNVFKGSIERLLTMPTDGVESVTRLIDGAVMSIRIKMFEFESAALVDALIAAKKRGIEITVLLNPARTNGARPNDETMTRLREADITADWTSHHFKITHEKSMVVDDETALISTFNWADKYFTKTRDYALLIDDPCIVAEIIRCFEADRRGEAFEASHDTPLAWGNRTARAAVAHFIDSAKHRLLIQHPKFRDSAILDHVLAALDRGVSVRFLCGGLHGIEKPDLVPTLSYQRILARTGVKVRKQHGVKLHAKILIADGERAMLGSMNIDRDAYDVRRELGIIFDDEATVAKLKAQFDADWHEAKRYEPVDPLDLDVSVDADDEHPVILHE